MLLMTQIPPNQTVNGSFVVSVVPSSSVLFTVSCCRCDKMNPPQQPPESIIQVNWSRTEDLTTLTAGPVGPGASSVSVSAATGTHNLRKYFVEKLPSRHRQKSGD